MITELVKFFPGQLLQFFAANSNCESNKPAAEEEVETDVWTEEIALGARIATVSGKHVHAHSRWMNVWTQTTLTIFKFLYSSEFCYFFLHQSLTCNKSN